jgi:large subunit ribosomal protein L17
VRHKVYGKHLSRTKNERTALFRNLVQSLIISEKIETTEAKAKAIKGQVDKLISSAKSPTTKNLVTQFLTKKETQDKLFNEIMPRIGSRISGFTTITKLGRRQGDGSMVVAMSLLLEEPKTKKSAAKKEAKKEEIKEENN